MLDSLILIFILLFLTMMMGTIMIFILCGVGINDCIVLHYKDDDREDVFDVNDKVDIDR